jgi:hypothetical protein
VLLHLRNHLLVFSSPPVHQLLKLDYLILLSLQFLLQKMDIIDQLVPLALKFKTPLLQLLLLTFGLL